MPYLKEVLISGGFDSKVDLSILSLMVLMFVLFAYSVIFCFIVRKKAKIRNPYNQIPRLIQDTIWESDKTKEKK